MKLRNFYMLFVSLMLLFASCGDDYSGDIDNLQKQITDLDKKVSELEKSQQEALLAEIAKLEAEIMALQEDNDELSSGYDQLLADLQELEEAILNSVNVFYGNVITDEDYAKFVEDGSEIVTGKVVIRSDAHVQSLAKLKMTGSHLEVMGGTAITLPALESVAGELLVTDVNAADAVVELPKLTSVGYSVSIKANDGLTALSAPMLVLINENLIIDDVNIELLSVEFEKLDLVGGNVHVDNKENTSKNFSKLTTLGLSSTDIKGYLYVSYTTVDAEVSELKVGVVSDSITLNQTGITLFEATNEILNEHFNLTGNGLLETISLPNCIVIDGELTIHTNTYEGSLGGSGLKYGSTAKTAFNLSDFDNITSITGDITIYGNAWEEGISAFNNLTSVGDLSGGSVQIEWFNNGYPAKSIEIFNELVEADNLDLTISDYTNWFIGFEKLSEYRVLEISITPGSSNTDTNCKLEGFHNVTRIDKFIMDVTYVTDFDAFDYFDDPDPTDPYGRLIIPKLGANSEIIIDLENDLQLCSMNELLTRIKEDSYRWYGASQPAITFKSYLDNDLSNGVESVIVKYDFDVDNIVVDIEGTPTEIGMESYWSYSYDGMVNNKPSYRRDERADEDLLVYFTGSEWRLVVVPSGGGSEIILSRSIVTSTVVVPRYRWTDEGWGIPIASGSGVQLDKDTALDALISGCL